MVLTYYSEDRQTLHSGVRFNTIDPRATTAASIYVHANLIDLVLEFAPSITHAARQSNSIHLSH